MRNDSVLCQTSEMALAESVRFQYTDHPARGCLGCFDNRIKLASEEGNSRFKTKMGINWRLQIQENFKEAL